MPCTIDINHASAVPKYRQIINSIRKNIECHSLSFNDQLPSINEVSFRYEVSRDTVEKAYRQLKREGVIQSVPGKGYFATQASLNKAQRILLVFNKLSAYKKMIFDSFVAALKGRVSVDLQVYYDDYELFEKIITERAGQYTHYIVIPFFLGEDELRARRLLLQKVPEGRLFLVSSFLEGLSNLGGAVFQNYEKDIYQALNQATPLLKKYRALQLIFPACTNYSRGIVRGFQRYCQEKQLVSRIIFKNFERENLQEGTAYLVINDGDLAILVKKIKEKGWHPKQEVGVMAYNDSPLKEILLDGITIISTDHQLMGEQMAHLLADPKGQLLEAPFQLIIRESL